MFSASFAESSVFPLLSTQAILDVVVNLQFALIEALWQTFWRNPPADAQQRSATKPLPIEYLKNHPRAMPRPFHRDHEHEKLDFYPDFI